MSVGERGSSTAQSETAHAYTTDSTASERQTILFESFVYLNRVRSSANLGSGRISQNVNCRKTAEIDSHAAD
jgi:hypothetical protein